MLIRDAICNSLPKSVEENPKYQELIWTVFCIGNYKDPNEFIDSLGMLTATNKATAARWAKALNNGQAHGSFNVYSYRLLHIKNMSLHKMFKDYTCNQELLIDELRLALDEIESDFDGIHFEMDEVVFLKSPRARMLPNSFK